MTRQTTKASTRKKRALGPDALVKEWRKRAKSGTTYRKEFGKLYNISAAIYLECAQELEKYLTEIRKEWGWP